MEVSVLLAITSNDGGGQIAERNACDRLDIEESLCMMKSNESAKPAIPKKEIFCLLFRRGDETNRRNRTAKIIQETGSGGGRLKDAPASDLRPNDSGATHPPAHSTARYDYWDDYTHEPTTRGNGALSPASGEWKEAGRIVST
jgi:hypothetical protein